VSGSEPEGVDSLNRDQAEGIFKKLSISPLFSRQAVAGWVRIDGRAVLPISYSNGNFHMDERVAFRFRRALLLSLGEFHALRDCTMSRDRYCALVRVRLPADG
jgi:hypothetical protein